MIVVRSFPDTWERFEQEFLIFFHSIRERLSRYLRFTIGSDDIDESNYYQRFVNLYKKMIKKILEVQHPLEKSFLIDSSLKTEKNLNYVMDWKNYVNFFVFCVEIEIKLMEFNLMGKMMRYRPKPSRYSFPD